MALSRDDGFDIDAHFEWCVYVVFSKEGGWHHAFEAENTEFRKKGIR